MLSLLEHCDVLRIVKMQGYAGNTRGFFELPILFVQGQTEVAKELIRTIQLSLRGTILQVLILLFISVMKMFL